MARIRTIKPEFFTSEDIVSLPPLARLLYVAVWCEADKEGRLVWKPRTLKLRYFPGDACDIDELCGLLVASGLVVLYGDGLAYIPTFRAHQHINPRESDSQLPVPTVKARVPTRAPRVTDASPTRREEGKGREGKGKEHASAFDAFWEAWPKSERKQDKAKCAEKFKAGKLADVLDAILADIEVKKRTDKWQQGYIEAPEVYLNNRRWEDGVTPGSAVLTPANTDAERTAAMLEADRKREAELRSPEGQAAVRAAVEAVKARLVRAA